MTRRLLIISLLVLLTATVMLPESAGRRRMTPVTTAATTTQAINETAADTSRINARRRAQSVSYLDNEGRTVYRDTITGDEWIDSTVIARVPKMEFPLLESVSVGVNIFDPMMRLFGQDYGVTDIWGELSLHNRYKPFIALGLGYAKHRPSSDQYVYRSPLSMYFRIGANYNFLFNSNPAYSIYAGVAYGFSPFSYSVTDVSLNSPYWDETAHFDVPRQRATAGWIEVQAGLRVKVVGPLYAGWSVCFHSILHQSKASYGGPFYIPGYGNVSNNFGASFSLIYKFGFRHANKPALPDVDTSEAHPHTDASETDNEPLQ